jgi:hypothetical protein
VASQWLKKPQFRSVQRQFQEGCVEFSRRNGIKLPRSRPKNPQNRQRFSRGRKNGNNCGPTAVFGFVPGTTLPGPSAVREVPVAGPATPTPFSAAIPGFNAGNNPGNSPGIANGSKSSTRVGSGC